MKKYIKLLCVLLLTVMICLCFCSCMELDQMRDKQAFWGSTEETLYFRIAEYKLLPACNDLSLTPGGHGYITENDVPVLLSTSLGQHMSYDRDAIFIVSGHWQNKPECNKVWCRADKYDEICKAIDSYTPDRYCVYNPKYADGDNYEEYISLYTLLSEEASEIIDTALSTEGILANEWNQYNYIAEIYACDEKLLFVSELPISVVELGNGEVFILKRVDDDWYKYSVSQENGESLVRMIYDYY